MGTSRRNCPSAEPGHPYEALLREFSDIIVLLLEHTGKADADAQNNEHETSLHEAALEGRLEATQLLHSHGANVHARNRARQTPGQLASSDSRRLPDLKASTTVFCQLYVGALPI
jgi:ankyrin repeat protein